MAFLLNIETSTTVCSVSLSEGPQLVAFREINNGFTHAENLHLFVNEILEESGTTLSSVVAIAVSCGPGSYTGLRIGVSAAKGFAYALGLPLISIDTLRILANHPFVNRNAGDFFCPMIDARRMEVYCALYDHTLSQEQPTEALIVDEQSIKKYTAYQKVCFFGDGMAKCTQILDKLPGAAFIEGVIPSAKNMPVLAWEKFKNKEFEDLAYFEPFYLKDFLLAKK